jgi:predicted Zn-dependent protease
MQNRSPGPIERLKAVPGLAGWVAEARRTLRYELYVVGRGTENRRRVEDLGGRVTLLATSGDGLGRATFDILGGRPEAFDAQIETALVQARLVSEPAWPLSGTGEYGKVPLLDPLVRDSGELMPQRVRAALLDGLARVPGVRLASAEIAVHKTNTSVVNSAGGAAENDESLYDLEVVLLAGSGPAEQEQMVFVKRRRFEDLDLEARIEREARKALDRVAAGSPRAGTGPVVFDAPLLGHFLKFLADAASGAAVHRKESPLAVGQPAFALGGAAGDPLTVEVNALFPFGPASYRIDRLGTAGTNVRIVEEGRFVRPHADAQYGHYLGLPATGAPGTIQAPPGTATGVDLRRDDHVEIVAVSDFVPQRSSGRFSAEIRLGYEVRGGSRRPIAGGTLSGNVLELLSRARWSKEVALHDQYVGPNVARVDTGLRIDA